MGKLGIPNLKTANDLWKFYENNIQKIQELKLKVLDTEASVSTLYNVDEISNLVSQTADTAQVVYDLFPSKLWKKQASVVQSLMQQTMHELNTERKLYDRLLEVQNLQLTTSQAVFLKNMLKECEKEGLDSESFLMANKLEQVFMSNAEQSSHGDFTPQMLKMFLSTNEDPENRKNAYNILMNMCPENQKVLTQLVESRQHAVKNYGFKNYSEYLLSYQTFPIHSESLLEVLKSCNDMLMPKMLNEYELLLDKKALKEQEDRHNPVSLHPWDTAFYVNSHMKDLRVQLFPNFNKEYDDSSFLTLYNVLESLKEITFMLFEVELEVSIASPEITWSDDILIIKLKKRGEFLGTLYLDLFARSDKFIHIPSKFNVVCPKRISDFEYQHPISVLSCGFKKPKKLENLNDLKEEGINMDSLRTLYHEYGHALHSLLGKSEFQAFSGTRVPIDFAELPSHIFEHFISDYDFLKSWAKHKTTNEAYPIELFKYVEMSKGAFKGLNHHIQLVISAFDISLNTTGSIETARSLITDNFNCKELTENWYLTCSHLGEYGSSYYSYVLNQALSEMVWKLVFRGKVDKEAGKLLGKSIMEVGGDRTGIEQLNMLLGPSFLPTEEPGTLDPFDVLIGYFNQEYKNVELIDLKEYRSKI